MTTALSTAIVVSTLLAGADQAARQACAPQIAIVARVAAQYPPGAEQLRDTAVAGYRRTADQCVANYLASAREAAQAAARADQADRLADAADRLAADPARMSVVLAAAVCRARDDEAAALRQAAQERALAQETGSLDLGTLEAAKRVLREARASQASAREELAAVGGHEVGCADPTVTALLRCADVPIGPSRAAEGCADGDMPAALDLLSAR